MDLINGVTKLLWLDNLVMDVKRIVMLNRSILGRDL